MPAARLIVTRPEREARRWLQDLSRLGVPTEALPLIEIAPLADSAALAAAWRDLPRYAALMFVSANAVDGFFSGRPAAAQLPDLRFLAPGPGTVAALLEAGVPPGRIDAPPADAGQFDSETLWQQVGARDWQAKAVLIVRGDSVGPGGGATPGRDWLARQWTAAGAAVDFVKVYERRPPQFGAGQLALAQAASRDGSVWLFSSSEAVTHLAGLGLDFSRARAIATHPRIAETARALGWGVVVVSRPELADIRAAWASIESVHDE